MHDARTVVHDNPMPLTDRAILLETVKRHDGYGDVDVLIEFEPGTRVGLAFFAIQDELSNVLGRRVDLNTVGSLSKYFPEEVLTEAKDIYVAA